MPFTLTDLCLISFDFLKKFSDTRIACGCLWWPDDWHGTCDFFFAKHSHEEKDKHNIFLTSVYYFIICGLNHIFLWSKFVKKSFVHRIDDKH